MKLQDFLLLFSASLDPRNLRVVQLLDIRICLSLSFCPLPDLLLSMTSSGLLSEAAVFEKILQVKEFLNYLLNGNGNASKTTLDETRL